MYQSTWGLNKPPFPSRFDPHRFFEGIGQREALARMRYLVAGKKRLGLLHGTPGVGKSALLHKFAHECRNQGLPAALVNLQCISAREFYVLIATELQATVRLEDDLPRLFRQLKDRVAENRLQDLATVLLLDDWDQAGVDLAGHVQRLLHWAEQPENLVTTILACNSFQRVRLGESLTELVDLTIEVAPWDELDTVGYLQFALVEAGASRPLFTDRAFGAIHRLSEGVPQVVRRLADQALTLAADNSAEPIDEITIHAALENLHLPVGV